MKLLEKKYVPKHNNELRAYAEGWNMVADHINELGYIDTFERECLLKVKKITYDALSRPFYKGAYDAIVEIEKLYFRSTKQEKALLVTDVLMVDGKYICCDEQHSCPIWNKEKWCCEYKRNTNTKDCPLKQLPKKQVEQNMILPVNMTNIILMNMQLIIMIILMNY